MWDVIDKELCELVGRLSTTEYRHALEAEVRLTTIRGGGGCDVAKFLPKFREKGAVTIIDVARDRVLPFSLDDR